ncbi:M14 family metallopeptidase [Sphingomonas montana]|uniref:M14 family metallopeptidase n=1 Tax=Sphingomonas montana TaxID=1843236 RepID=UPI00096D2ACC|nr:M14 family metallopeptidase [Sphingomonas montana]
MIPFLTMLAAAFPQAPLPPVQPWAGGSIALVARPGDPWITPSETTGFAKTPSYAETRAWIDRLVAASPLLRIEPFGRSPEGRVLYAVVASKPGLMGTGTNKPVMLVQAGIHAGEIDGKDAGLMLLRDIALRGKDGLLDRATLVFVPIFNVDGHERAGDYNRPNQRGPNGQGWRTTAQNLNLNRDYLKADTPEMQAMIGLIRRWDPALYLDIHVTDGIDYQYDITTDFNGYGGRYAQSPAVGRWLDRTYRPAVEAALTAAGHRPYQYISAIDPNPDKGIEDTASTGRYSDGYGDLRHVPTVLVETHSLKPYRQRVLGSYVLMEASLRLIGAQAAGARTAIAADRRARPAEQVLEWKRSAAPIASRMFDGISHEMAPSAAAGGDVIRWTGRPTRIRMPIWGEEAAVTTRLPRAWWVPASRPDVIARLRLHGVTMETITAARSVAVDRVRLVDPVLGAANEGRVPLKSASYVHAAGRESWPAGSVRVPADQPLGQLAAAMLEPESPDGLLAWGLFPEILQRTEYMEPYVVAPMADAMLARDPALKAAFDAKVKADPAFAADRQARLAWFYERSPYHDARYLLYPVAREVR